jgi:hypothetical protein
MDSTLATIVFASGAGAAALGVAAATLASRARPPTALLATALGALILAALHIGLGAALSRRERSGLWARDTIVAIPSTLGVVAGPALAVWVALWTADRTRLTTFAATEGELFAELTGALAVLARVMEPARDFFFGTNAPAVV